MNRKGCGRHGGGRDPFCDACDGISNDPHTGWGGFRDHSVNKDFKTEEERRKWYEDNPDYDWRDDED